MRDGGAGGSGTLIGLFLVVASGRPAAISLSTAVESSVDLADRVAFLAVVNLVFVREPELEEPLQAA